MIPDRNAYLQRISPVESGQCDGASFLQSRLWGEFKSRFGWEARYFLAEWRLPPGARDGEAGLEAIPLMVLTRSFSLKPLGRVFSFAYVPWGPEIPQTLGAFPEKDIREGLLGELALSLREFLPKDTGFIRFDPPWSQREGAEDSQNSLEASLGKPFIRAGADVQPPDTVIINLEPSEEEILGRMKPKWRYNIKLAEKKGVKVRQSGAEELPVFHALFRETARRDGIGIHSLEYYKTLFDLCAEGKPDARGAETRNSDIRLYIASHEGEDLGAAIALFSGERAYYLYGASSDTKRNLMAPYALQWIAMRDAKKAGCREYDLFGIPPREDPTHPMAGLYRFKTGFGGEIVHRMGCWDYPYRPLTAKLFNAAEGFRKYLRSLKKR